MNSLSVLILLQLPKFKRKIIVKILNDYSNIPTNIFKLTDFLNNLIYNGHDITLFTYDIVSSAISNANRIIKECESSSISIMNYSQDIFPQKLKIIPYPPLLLYYKGDIKYINKRNNVAIIGTRTPSLSAKSISKNLGLIFTVNGFTVVSGLALGCDTYGHLGSLKKSGNNIAILPCGLNNIYPAENVKLSNQIIENGGCLISEYPPNAKLRSQYFVLRDRLQSGIVSVVVIVESSLNGGTMHTAKFALEQNKILICISPNLLGGDNFSNKGNNLLIKDKMAIALTNFQDMKPIVESILNNSLKPIFVAKEKEQLKYEQLKFKL